MTEQDTGTVLAKVRKLLALAGNNPSQTEAEAAMMRAQQLLSKHGLSMAEAESGTEEKTAAVEKTADAHAKVATWWQKMVCRVVADNFRCRTFIHRDGKGQTNIIIVGLPLDVEIANEVYSLAVRTAALQASLYLASEKARCPKQAWSRSLSSKLRNDYLFGWIEGIEVSFRKNVETHALVVVAPEQVEEHIAGKKLRKGKSSTINVAGNSNAGATGKRDGSRFNDRKQIHKGG